MALCASTAHAEVTLLDEIVISPSRTEQTISATGMSVSVVTTEQLADLGATPLSDVVSSLPGVSVTQNGPVGSNSSVRMRGLPSRYTAVYIDGIRVDDPTSTQVQFDNFSGLTASEISRIEIVRGAQSAMYGGSAIGGVVNITTNKATENPGWQQHADFEFGSYDTHSSSYKLINSSKNGFVKLGVSRFSTEGFSAKNRPTDNSDDDGFQKSATNFEFRHHITDHLEIGTIFNRSFSKSEYDDGWKNTSLQSQKGIIKYTTKSMENVLEVSKLFTDRRYDGFSIAGSREEFAYRGKLQPSNNLTLNYGLESSKEEYVTTGLATNKGAYFQALIKPTDNVDVSASIRKDDGSEYGDFTSKRLALSWQISQLLSVRANAGTGFRAPSINEATSNTAWGVWSDPQLDVENSKSVEMGVDLFLGHWGQTSVTLFESEVDNAIVYCGWPTPCTRALPAGFSSAYFNESGLSTTKGIEISYSADLSRYVQLDTNYTRTLSKKPSGERIENVFSNDFGIGITSDVTERLKLRASVNRMTDNANPMVKDFTVVNASLRYNLNDSVDFSLRLENIFDEKYELIDGYNTPRRSAYFGLSAAF